MPNFAGIFQLGAEGASLGQSLDRMLAAIDLPGFHFSRSRAVVPGAALGNLAPIHADAEAIAKSLDGRTLLLLDGYILNAPELRRAHGIASGAFGSRSGAELALYLYQKQGPGFQNALNGSWNIVIWDDRQQFAVVVSDFIGARHLFYANDGDRWVFCSEMKGVVAGRAEASTIGGIGLLNQLMSGTTTSDTTWLEGVRLFDPGTWLVIRKGSFRKLRYRKLHFNEGEPQMPIRDCAVLFGEKLRAATERAVRTPRPCRVGITLSGGLDSRAVGLSIPSQLLPIPSFTYGDETSADVRYARQLAEVIGFDHHYIDNEHVRLVADAQRVYREAGDSSTKGFYSSQVERIIWRNEALSPFDGMASVLWHPIYSRSMNVMLNGAAGDAMTGSHLNPRLLLNPSRQQLVERFQQIFQSQDPDLIRPVCNDRFYRRFYRDLPELAYAATRDVDADQPWAFDNILDMENRQRRGAFSSFTMERYFCSPRTPFIDHDLVEFLCTVPAQWRFQQRLYKRMIVTQFPQAAHVPWAYTGGRITTSPAYEFAREVTNFSWRKVRSLFPQEEGPAHYEFRDAAKMAREDPSLRETLVAWTKSDLFPADALDAPGIRAFAERYPTLKDIESHVLFTQLLGIAVASKMFLADRDVRIPKVADPVAFGVVVDP